MKKQKVLHNVDDFSDEVSDLESDQNSHIAHEDMSSGEVSSEIDNSVESEGSNGFRNPFRSDGEVGVVQYGMDLPRGSEYDFVSVM